MDTPIVLFDGVCNLCNGAVQFIIANDRTDTVKFASLQSEAGKTLLLKYNLPTENFSSFVVILNRKVYLRSSASLKLASYLRGLWRLLAVLWIFPRFLRDAVYNLIAKNRYKWFGQKTECMMPTPALKARFLSLKEEVEAY